MKNFNDLLTDLKSVDSMIGHMLADSSIEFYLAGGSACILAGFMERAIRVGV